ncbi:MAG: hypothetical protein ABII98_02000 [bacterium]
MPTLRRRKFMAVAMALLVSVMFLLPARSAFNEQINYQGKLTGLDNVPVADAGYNMRFRLCVTPACSGEIVWSETHCYSSDGGDTCDGAGSDQRVSVENGLFSIMLDSVTSSFSSINFNQTLYLEVSIGGTSTPPSWETLSPARILGTVPAAMESKKLGGKEETEFGTLDENETVSGQWLFNNILSITANSASPVLSVTQSGAGLGVSVGNGTSSTTISVDGIVSSTASDLRLAADGANEIQFWTNGIQSMIVDGNGKVGVGTTTARTAMLTVKGSDNVGTAVFDITNNSGTSKFTIGNYGNLTNNPYITWSGSGVNIPTGSGSLSIAGSSNNTTYLKINGTGSANFMDIQDNGTSVFMIKDGGNIGIGTTGPSDKLTVANGNLVIGDGSTSSTLQKNQIKIAYTSANPSGVFTVDSSGNVSASGTLYLRNSTLAAISAPASDLRISAGTGKGIQFYTNSSGARMHILSNGNVGIGTTTPGRPLTVETTSDTYLSIRTSNATKIAGLLFGDATDYVGRISYDNNNDSMYFYANGGEKMRITSAGYLGIGTTTPQSALSVIGDIAVGDGATSSTLSGTTTSTFEYGINLMNGCFAINGVCVGGSGGDAYLANEQTFTGLNTFSATTTLATTTISNLTVSEFTQGSIVFAGASGLITQDNAKFFWDDGSDYLGIGTNSPGVHLDVRSSGDTTNATLRAASANANLYLALESGTDANPAEVEFRNGNGLKFRDGWNGLDRMIIDSSGNVGIGTLLPSDPITVNDGGSADAGIVIGSGSASSTLRRGLLRIGYTDASPSGVFQVEESRPPGFSARPAPGIA